MYKSYISEFSRFYQRLMNLEHSLKQNIIEKYSIVHNQNAFKRVFPYLTRLETNPKILSRYNRCFTRIVKSNKTFENKLFEAINRLYFSDTVDLLEQKLFYDDKVYKVFFKIKPGNELAAHKSKIKKFR